MSTNADGVLGRTERNTFGAAGVRGVALNGNGVGESTNFVGVHGRSENDAGVLGASQAKQGVIGRSIGSAGVEGSSAQGIGVWGYSTGANCGVFGQNDTLAGVAGTSLNRDRGRRPLGGSGRRPLHRHQRHRRDRRHRRRRRRR